MSKFWIGIRWRIYFHYRRKFIENLEKSDYNETEKQNWLAWFDSGAMKDII